ncbi:MAG: ammonium transporter [Alphaproteobacteria bacterium]
MLGQEEFPFGWLIFCSILLMMARAGFVCIFCGVANTKANINVAIKTMVDFCVSIFCFWIFGFSLMNGLPEAVNGGMAWPISLGDSLHTENLSLFLFHLMNMSIVAIMICGSLATRLAFPAFLCTSVAVSLVIYPLSASWNIGGVFNPQHQSWLKNIGFIDVAGGASINVLAGNLLLAFILIGGRDRQIKKGGGSRNRASKVEGYDLTLTSIGMMLIWLGWFGLVSGHLQAKHVGNSLINLLLTPAAAGFTSLWLSSKLEGRINHDVLISGVLAGIISVAAGVGYYTPFHSVILGVIAGIANYLVRGILTKKHIRDSSGCLSSNLAGGVWGVLAVALLAVPDRPDYHRGFQFLIQLMGLMCYFSYSFIIGVVFFRLLSRFFPITLSAAQEKVGLNMHELAAGGIQFDLIDQMKMGFSKTNQNIDEQTAKLEEEIYEDRRHEEIEGPFLR